MFFSVLPNNPQKVAVSSFKKKISVDEVALMKTADAFRLWIITVILRRGDAAAGFFNVIFQR